MDDYSNIQIPADSGKHFTEEGFFDKVKRYAAKIGYGLLTQAFCLYHAAQRPDCPMQVKVGIYGALGYLILPLDVIPDFTPVVGYADDAGAIALAISLAQAYIDDDVKKKAHEHLISLLGEKAVAMMEKAAADRA